MLIEKPLASADARVVRDRAGVAEVKDTMLFNHRWVLADWQAKERSSDGALGELVLAYARKNDTIEVPTEMLSRASATTPEGFLSSTTSVSSAGTPSRTRSTRTRPRCRRCSAADGFEPLVSLESSVRVTRVMEAIHRSCSQGPVVSIEQEEQR